MVISLISQYRVVILIKAKGRNMKIQWLLIAIAVFVAGCSPAENTSSESQSQPAQVASAAEAPGNDIPRTPSGKPDFNGIWQALMNANDNVEAAPPKAAYHLVPGDFVPVPGPEVVALGAVGAVPASFGVVEGGTIPYKPEMLARRDENRENWLTRDPEIKCYMPGVPRANYQPHPFQIFNSYQRDREEQCTTSSSSHFKSLTHTF